MRRALLAIAALLFATQASAQVGPQPTIPCPVGSINIFPGTSIASVLSANPTGATFCLHAGTYTPSAPIRPKSGQTLIGEVGTVIDGTNVVQGYDVTGTAIISGWNDLAATNVTLRNLVVRNNPYICIGSTASGWHVDHVEVSGCWQGINLGSNAYVGFNFGHDTGKGIGVTSLQPWGMGYGGFQVTNQLWEQNEFARNLGDSKWTNSSSITFRGNHVHDQQYGIWFDGDNHDDLVEDNTFEDLSEQAVMNEISGSLIVRRNTIKRASIAVFISTSRDTEVYGNYLEDNWRSLELYVNCYALFREPAYSNRMDRDLANNQIHHNTIVTTANVKAGVLINGLGGFVDCSALEQQPFLTNAKGNTFDFNAYQLADQNGPWMWGALLNWASWQGLPQDPSGTLNGTGTTEPPPPPPPPPPPVCTLAPLTETLRNKFVSGEVTRLQTLGYAVTTKQVKGSTTITAVCP